MPDTIRFAKLEDAAAIQEIYAPIVLHTATSFEYEPPPAQEVRRRIESNFAQYPWLVCERDSQVVGYAYAGKFRERPAYRWTAELSVYVRSGFHRQGIATRLYEALFHCLRMQGFHTAVAGITLPNEASVVLHERMGFQEVGVFRAVGFKFDEWRDVAWYRRDLQLGSGAPAELRTVAEIAALPECRDKLAPHALQS